MPPTLLIDRLSALIVAIRFCTWLAAASRGWFVTHASWNVDCRPEGPQAL